MKAKIILTAGLAFSAVAAHAFTYSFISSGVYSTPSVGDVSFSGNVIFQTVPFTPFSTLALVTSGSGGNITISGLGSDKFVYTITEKSPLVFNGSTGTVKGKFNTSSATGAYAGQSVSGDFSVTLNSSTGTGFVQVTGIQAVPEPTTMAVLGLGLAAAARRRRKSN